MAASLPGPGAAAASGVPADPQPQHHRLPLRPRSDEGHHVRHLHPIEGCSTTMRVIGWIATAICAAAFVVGLLGTLGILATKVPHLAPALAGAGGVAFVVAMGFMIKDALRSCRAHDPVQET